MSPFLKGLIFLGGGFVAEIANIEESPISLKDVLIILTVLAAVLLMVNLNVLPWYGQ
jgi:hypothetical protein